MEAFWGDPGQNRAFWDSKVGVKHFKNSRNHENQGFEMFGKVEEGWHIALGELHRGSMGITYEVELG